MSIKEKLKSIFTLTNYINLNVPKVEIVEEQKRQKEELKKLKKQKKKASV